jgi:cytochrome c oxidase subunit 2
MGIVPNASEHGPLIDHFLEVCHWFMAALFIGWTTYFFYTIWRFHHSRNPKANYHGVKSKASAHLEFTVVLVEAILLFGLGIPLWDKRTAPNEWPDKDQALRVHAVGEQFMWNFHYPGPDGVFGRQYTRLVTGSNPLGLDPDDPAGKDDIVSRNELHLIENKPTVIEITSKDVIHSLSLHPMRMCQDAIPGSRIPMWFRPIKIGQWEIVCAQLCGAGHSQMRALLMVEKQADYDAWFKEQSGMQHPAAAKATTQEAPVSEFKKLAVEAAK